MGIIADTLKAKKTLLEAGVSEEMAEGIIEVVNGSDAQVATKLDLDLFRKDMKVEIGEVRGEIDKLRQETKAEFGDVRGEIDKLHPEIGQLRKDLTIRMGGIMAVGVTLMLALMSVGIAILK